jgi:serine/threonine-protein kinase HipA
MCTNGAALLVNEHLRLEAARRLGLTAAVSSVQSFEDERVIVVDRYDRVYDRDGRLRRLHQEDVCQALGLMPTAKYQNEGGPSPEAIIALLRRVIRPAATAEQSVAGFVDALAFNWIIVGTDAHAKNYSLLLSANQVRLAPLYDVTSALPYDDMYLPKLKLAMRIGGEYRAEAVSGRHWRRFAEANSLDPEGVTARISELARRAPEAFAAAAALSAVGELGSSLPDRLVGAIDERSRACLRAMTR